MINLSHGLLIREISSNDSSMKECIIESKMKFCHNDLPDGSFVTLSVLMSSWFRNLLRRFTDTDACSKIKMMIR